MTLTQRRRIIRLCAYIEVVLAIVLICRGEYVATILPAVVATIILTSAESKEPNMTRDRITFAEYDNLRDCFDSGGLWMGHLVVRVSWESLPNSKAMNVDVITSDGKTLRYICY